MSSRTSRACTSVSTHKHQLLKEIPKCSNHLVKDCYTNHKKLIDKKRRNVLFQKRDTTLYYNPLLSNELRSHRRKIQNCDSIEEINDILSNLSSISKSNISILCNDYMKQCIRLQKHTECINILQAMYHHNIPRTLATYNIIFDGYVTYDNTHSAMKIYSEYMLTNENMKSNIDLQPNIITANTLLSGCKHRANIYLVKQIWNDIVMEYNIIPNIATYNILITIYGRAGLTDHCYALFTNMIIKDELEPNTGICGALLNAYAMKGDVKCCYQILKYMEMNKIPITIIEYCTLMKCYLRNNQFLNVLNIYQNIINHHVHHHILIVFDHKTIEIMASMRMSCYVKLIQEIFKKDELSEKDIENVKNYFKFIMQNIPFDIKVQCKYDSNNFYDYLNDILLQNMLNILIIMNDNGYRFNENYENEMLTFLENGWKNNRFGFWHPPKKNKIDFHRFWVNNCLLILRYVVSFERKYIENKLNYDIKIIVGSGTHSERNIRKDKNKDECKTILTSISTAIEKEVLSWTPCVKIDKIENDAVLVLDSNDLKQFLKQNAKRTPWFNDRVPT